MGQAVPGAGGREVDTAHGVTGRCIATVGDKCAFGVGEADFEVVSLELGALGVDHLQSAGAPGLSHRSVGEVRLESLDLRFEGLPRDQADSRVDDHVIEEREHCPVDVSHTHQARSGS